MPIVTIGQQIGSGPRLAPVVAEQLGVPCYDDEIVTRAARRAGCSVASFRKMDERPPSMLSYLIEVMGVYGDTYRQWAPYAPLMIRPPTLERLVSSRRAKEAIEETIRAIAATGKAIIVGRGSQVILRGRPQAVHVRVTAPMEHRVTEVMRLHRLDRTTARNIVLKDDRRKAGYLKAYYGADLNDSRLYDLTVNTAILSPAQAVSLVTGALRGLEERGEGVSGEGVQPKKGVVHGISA